ncbi:MAG: methionyl-tRNA formyltransferase [Clostridia bacterium]|nr:methionyl-tRNA formyltransferase [Clostridia bacterium]
MRIVFMGTPEYSVATLKALINAGHSVEAVFCQPDKPVGRKRILTAPPVKVYAEEQGIKVYQPDSLRTDEAYEILKNIAPDVIVVVAYGKILPERILSLPRLGCFNGHASILPKYRGASPIQWAIVNGEKETGVTVQQMDKGIDTGDILGITKVEINDDEISDTLFEKLSTVSADLMVETLLKAENGALNPIKQNENEASYAPIITKEMALIDFNKPAEEIRNLVRGFNSWPVAFCYFEGKRLKIYGCTVSGKSNAAAGTVVDENTLAVACGDGQCIILTDIQLEGGKRMSAYDFLKGKKIPNGMVLTQGEDRG